MSQRYPGPSPSPPPPVPGVSAAGPPSAGGTTAIMQQLEALSNEQLEALLKDESAFRQFLIKHTSDAPAAKTLQDIVSRNRVLAQENLDMQASIEEARNHLAVVKSSEFSSARSGFAELQARQQAVLDTVGPKALLDLLTRDVDKLDEKSGALHDQLLAGTLTTEAFVEQYLAQRTAFHLLDTRRQVAQYSLQGGP